MHNLQPVKERKKRNGKVFRYCLIYIIKRGFVYYVQERETCNRTKLLRKCLYGFTVSALFTCWTPLCLQIVLQKLFTPSRFTKDSCIIFVSSTFSPPWLKEGKKIQIEAYQKLEGRLKLKVIRRFRSLSVISFWIF